MKKLCWLCTVLLCILSGCTSNVIQPEEIPGVNYSLVGRDDSIIIAYIDHSLLLPVSPIVKVHQWLTFMVWASPDDDYDDDYSLERIINYTHHLSGGGTVWTGYHQSGQFSIPNGTYSLQVTVVRGATGLSDNLSGRTVALPFETELQDVAVLSKIRLATDEEKRAAFIGLGNEVYTLEEVSRTKLR